MKSFLKEFNITSTVVLILAGALTAFLWLPLVPLLVPLVTLAIGFRWISASLLSDARFGNKASSSELLYFPTHNKHIPPSQATKPTAWSSSAGQPSPARTGSLPYHETKNFKRRLRESRHIARVMNGLDLRRSASAHQ